MQILVIAARNLRRRTIRTIVALAGVAVGVSVVVSIFISAGGLRRQFYRMAEAFRGDLIATNKLAFLPDQSRVSESAAARIAEDARVESVSLLRLWRQPITNAKGLKQPILCLGLRAGDKALSRYPIAAGRSLAPDDTGVLLIGELLAGDLGLALGDEVEVLGRKRRIIGTFRSPLAGVPFLSGGLLLPLQDMCAALAPDTEELAGNIAIVHVAPPPGEDAGRESLRDFDERVAAAAEALPADHPQYKILPIAEYLDSFQAQLEIVDKFSWALSLLAVLAGGIGIMNTMIMSVFERTREIGLLKALGWPPAMIMAMIIAEGAILSLLGGIAGIPVGLLEVQAATYLIKLGWIEVAWDGELFAKAVALAAVMGVIGSIYPAVRAAAFPPTEALRYE